MRPSNDDYLFDAAFDVDDTAAICRGCACQPQFDFGLCQPCLHEFEAEAAANAVAAGQAIAGHIGDDDSEFPRAA